MKKSKVQVFLILSKALFSYIKTSRLIFGASVILIGAILSNSVTGSLEQMELPCESAHPVFSQISVTDKVQAEDLKKYLRDRPFIDSFPADPRKTYTLPLADPLS